MIANAKKRKQPTLLQEAAEWFRPKPLILPSEWASRHGYLDDQVEATGGRYDFTHRPWFAQPIDYLYDDEVRFVNLMMSPQLGKTILLIMSVMCCADQYPCPAMCVLPNKDLAIDFRDRVYGNALVGPLTKNLPPPESKWNTREIDLGGMRINLAWSGSKSGLRSKRCKRVWLSEIDVYDSASKAGDPLRSAEQRTKAFFRWQIWKESSPVAEPSRIGQAFYGGREHYWYFPCPCCGWWQEPRFFVHKEGHPFAGKGGVEGWKDEAGARLSSDDARANAFYRCEQGCKIEPDDKQEMLLRGRWWTPGQQFEGRGESAKLVGESIKPRRSMSHHLWEIFNDSVSIGDLAANWVSACESDTVSDFWQNTLSKPHSKQAPRPEWEVLGRRNAGDHPRGVIPEWIWFLTAGIDVQHDHVKWVIRGWGGQKSSALISWGIFEQKPGDESLLIKSDLLQVVDLLQDSFPVRGGKGNPQGEHHLRVLLGGIDCGHRSLEVHRLLDKIRLMQGFEERIIPVRGDANVPRALRWRYSEIKENTRSGVEYEEVHEEYQLAVDVFKEELAERQAADPKSPGMWLVTSDCLKAGKTYLKEVVNETRVLKKNKSGVDEYVWERVSRANGVDYWDSEVYASACAEMIVFSRFREAGWDADHWRALSNAKGPRFDRQGVDSR